MFQPLRDCQPFLVPAGHAPKMIFDRIDMNKPWVIIVHSCVFSSGFSYVFLWFPHNSGFGASKSAPLNPPKPTINAPDIERRETERRERVGETILRHLENWVSMDWLKPGQPCRAESPCGVFPMKSPSQVCNFYTTALT